MFQTEDPKISVEGWIAAVTKLATDNKELFMKIKRIYVMVDNIEEFDFKQNFLSKVYLACKREIPYIKISFVFVGMNHRNRVFSEQEPFKTIPSFFMNRPPIDHIIYQVLKCGFGDNTENSLPYKYLVG